MAISSLLELINHSQSLALVIQDKNQRYKRSETNPLSGQLQMVTLPPVYPALLKVMELRTDFYQVILKLHYNTFSMVMVRRPYAFGLGPVCMYLIFRIVFLSCFQRAAEVLWAQIDSERREQHVSGVELFYRLHCLAPSTAICEDIICMALLNRDKVIMSGSHTLLLNYA